MKVVIVGAGAVGLLAKTGDVEQLRRAIRAVAGGATIWPDHEANQ